MLITIKSKQVIDGTGRDPIPGGIILVAFGISPMEAIMAGTKRATEALRGLIKWAAWRQEN